MNKIETAKTFFGACETGKGWAKSAQDCAPEASFVCQSVALAHTHSLEVNTEWINRHLLPLADGRYELKAFAEDAGRGFVLAFAVLHGTHSADGGPLPATNQSVAADYVYSMEFAGGKISHMTKLWNDTESLKSFGWA